MHKINFITITLLSALSGIIQAQQPTTTTPTPNPAPNTTPQVQKDPSVTEPSAELTKSQWLNNIVPMLPSLICKGFMNDPDLKQRFTSIKMDYAQCLTTIPSSVAKCETQLSTNLPEKITNNDAAIWGKALGECIGKDFAVKYLLPK